ncbi:hypothetical protein ACWJJH_16515 [Endozoicomonadaceae bacterium StTr2]
MERPVNQLALAATIICFSLALLGFAVSAEDELVVIKEWIQAEFTDQDGEQSNN